MASSSQDPDPIPSVEIKPYTTIHELDSVTDEPDAQNDELDESAPNWAFASFVAERDELLSLFGNLKPVEHAGRLIIIIEKYQEQPQLLDPHLAFMTATLFDSIRGHLSGAKILTEIEVKHLLYLVYTLCKVRGYKTVSRLFPHSVEDLEPTYKLLEKCRLQAQTPTSSSSAHDDTQSDLHPLILQARQFALDEIEWRAPYVLLLWLSVIGLIPFDLNALDNDSTGMPLKHKLLDISNHYLKESNITHNAAAELLSTLLTRPDMKVELGQFIESSISTVTRLSNGPASEKLVSTNQFLVAGLYTTLALIFQKGEREHLMPHVVPVLKAFFPATPASDDATPTGQSGENGDDEQEMLYELPSNVLINKKLSVKLVQRLGSVLLAPRIPKWRYQRRTVSLLSNLAKGPKSASTNALDSTNADSNADEEDEEEEYEIPEELEIFVQLLLSALRDKDTIVRWSAAKGIGRLTHRLSQSLADEIVGTLLELFDERETDCAWHGACLSIAELARRGLLLPSRMPELLLKLNTALQYEIRRGNHTTGHHVRDAACYVAWAIARAYDPSLLRNYLAVSLASALLTTALFDKEVNCRRAAAAAFQEHVGRQGTFPHGIDIITLVNFFTLSNRSEAYLTISPQVASYEEYAKPLMDSLAFSKSHHVDHNIRDLAAKTLGKLTLNEIHRPYVTGTLIPKLIPLAVHPDFATRQGCIQTLAEIIFSLSSVASEDKVLREAQIAGWISPEVQQKLWNIPAEVERSRLYRGRGSEYLRIAVSRLIKSISELGLSLKHTATASQSAAKPSAAKGPAIAQRLAAGVTASKISKDTLTFFIETLEENLRQSLETVVEVAVEAARSLAGRYLPTSGAMTGPLLDRWMKIIATDTNQAARRGHCLALGALPLSSISGSKFASIVDTLLNSMKVLGKKHHLDDAEVRKNAIVGLADLVSRTPVAGGENTSDHCSLTRDQISRLIDAYLTAMDDYSTDNRGDIGSLVRETAISAFGQLIVKLRALDAPMDKKSNDEYIPLLPSSSVLQFVGKLLRLALEKIDRTRERAGVMFEQLVRCTLGLPSTAASYRFATWSQVNFDGTLIPSSMIPHSDLIWQSIEESCKSVDARSVITNSLNWTSSRVVFPILVPLMNYSEYRYWLLLGIIRSVGGANNSKELVEDASGNFMRYLRGLKKLEALNDVATAFTSIMKDHVGNEQVITVLWNTIDLVLTSGLLLPLRPPAFTFAADLLALSRAELRLPSSISKLTASVPIFAHLLAYPGDECAEIRNSALKMLLFFLGYKYPVIRKLAAELLYLQLETSLHLLVNERATPTELEVSEGQLTKAKEILSTVSWAWDTEYQAAKESLTSILMSKA
jgi:hypothetical protein